MLEQLARDVSGWNARAVEFFQVLATTQYMNHVRPLNWYAPDLRLWEPLERLETAFNSVAHTIDVRRIQTGEGRYNIPNIGIFLWRLGAYSLTDSPAVAVDGRRFMLSPLGNNTPMFNRPQTEDEITHLAEPINVPEAISRRVFDADIAAYYGRDLSLSIRADGVDVPLADIESCNLEDAGGGDWAHHPANMTAIDPVLGRIAFPLSLPAPTTVEVLFHYGFSADTGGGEYERAATFEREIQPVEEIAAPDLIQDAAADLASGGAVQIADSARYVETPAIAVDAGRRLEIRAANGHRPTLELAGNMDVSGGSDSEVNLNGLLVAGGRMRVMAAGGNALRLLRLRHCTLVPGIGLTRRGMPTTSGAPSLIVSARNVVVEIEDCVLGGLRVHPESSVRIRNSIIDANEPDQVAFAAINGQSAGGRLRIENSTVIGKVHTAVMELASNTIFMSRLAPGDGWTAPVRAERKQDGCVRYSYVPPGSRVPRRYRCQPSLAITMAIDKAKKKNPALTALQEARITDSIRLSLQPRLAERRYGAPDYAQLAPSCPVEIRTGADDEAEMGAFHKLFQPQREANIRIRLDEYLRLGLEAGVFHAT